MPPSKKIVWIFPDYIAVYHIPDNLQKAYYLLFCDTLDTG